MEIELNYADWKSNVDTKELDHFSYTQDNHYHLLALDGILIFKHKLDIDDNLEYETNYLPNANKKLGSFYSREPFATKTLKDGSKLFRRKHGVFDTIPANSEKSIIFTAPYAKAKINKLEIIDANARDQIDMRVKSPVDPTTAAAYGFPPDISLNQFGFNVVVSDLLYSDKSDYDAEVYAGMQIEVVYKNRTNAAKEVGFNLIYHEVV